MELRRDIELYLYTPDDRVSLSPASADPAMMIESHRPALDGLIVVQHNIVSYFLKFFLSCPHSP